MLLNEGLSFYIKLLLLSCGIMIGISALIKFPLSEDMLLYLGFSGNPSAWEFAWVPPIFHGIDGANIRRFQGILDGPNTMGAFLIFFTGIFAYYFRSFKDWYFTNGGIILILVVMVVYTYSRSALLWILCAITLATIGSMRSIFKKYKKEFLILSTVGIFLCWIFYIQYADRIWAIVGRAWSTKGHFERMSVGIARVVESPLGQGLGSAWPAYRYVENLEWQGRQAVEEKDRFFIPESWYIQQFIEWGLISGIAFLMLMWIFFIRLMKKHLFLGSMFVGIGVMNLFLHTFESSPFSLILFIFVGLIFWFDRYGKRVPKK